MQMYVANETQQDQVFIYRVPEAAGARTQMIPVGHQVKLSGELSPQAIDGIIEQHAVFGLTRWDEVDRTKPFVGLVYCLGKPVPHPIMVAALEHNEQVLIKQGEMIREEAAIALDHTLMTGTGSAYHGNLEMHVEEITRDQNDLSPEVNVGVRVARRTAAGAPSGRRKRTTGRGKPRCPKV